jgi:hypothetical protein
MDARTRALFEVNIDDILAALGWEKAPALRALVRLAARRPALLFAGEMAGFDDVAAASGIRTAARMLLSRWVRDIAVSGAERIPARGAVLLLSNHPGMTDTLALLAAIPRPDLRVLAAERPFLTSMPAVSRSLIFLPDDRAHRIGAVRQAIGHLRAGGALLTFPAGEIEPDPAVLPGAVEALGRWSESTLVFLRLVPDCTVVPLVVSGVLASPAQRHPLALVRRRKADRERLAAMLQVLMHTVRPDSWRVRVRVDIPGAFNGRELSAEATARTAFRDAVAQVLHQREKGSPELSSPGRPR